MTLYTAELVDLKCQDWLLNQLNTTLTPEDQEKCEGALTLSECYEALSQMQTNKSITLAPSPSTILFKHGLPTGDKRSIALVHVIINVTLNEIWAARNLATFGNKQHPASATILKV